MVRVDLNVLDGIRYVMGEGINLYDIESVVNVLAKAEYYEAADWVFDNPTDYGRGIEEGFDMAS